ncbi:hypothetical protein RFI_29073, partial [Reticulomyxa filosa]
GITSLRYSTVPFSRQFSFSFAKQLRKDNFDTNWKCSEKTLREYILSLDNAIALRKKGKKPNTNDPIVRVQCIYDHILCLREWLESLYGTSDKFRFGWHSFTKFVVEINEGKIALVIDEENDNNNNDSDDMHYINSSDNSGNDGSGNASAIVAVDTNIWKDIQIGDEFAHICQEGSLAMKKEHTQKTNETEANNRDGNGWNILDLLKADDEIEKQKFNALLPKSYLFWKKKIKFAKEQINLFIAMLNKAHKSIRKLTVTHAFDQMIVFPVLPNLVHLELENIKIGSCFNSINVKESMPQLKTLQVNHLSTESCAYCNWKQVLEVVETCNFSDYNSSLSTFFPDPSFDCQQKQEPFEIKFLNHLLLSCPNLLAFYYFGEHENSEDILEIPSTLEWLMIDGKQKRNRPLCVRLDLSRCKRINKLVWNPCFIKWPTETILKIGWLGIRNTEDIRYWEDLLSLPNKCCDVQLCMYLPERTIHDLTSDNWIFPQFLFSRKKSKQIIAARPGIYYEHAKRLLQRSVYYEYAKQLLQHSKGFNPKDNFLQTEMVFFQKIVEIMKIDDAQVMEYQRWINNGEIDWITF